MKREIIDASQLELNEKVVSIKRVTKVVKGGCFSPASSSFICSSSKASLYFSSAQLVTAVMPLRTGVVTIPTRLDRGSATPPNSIDTTAVTRASRMAAIKIRIPLCRKKSFTSVRSLSLSRCPARPPPGAGSPRRAGAGCRPGGTRAGP